MPLSDAEIQTHATTDQSADAASNSVANQAQFRLASGDNHLFSAPCTLEFLVDVL